MKMIKPFARNWLDATADRGDTLEEYLDDVEKQYQEIADARNGKGGIEKCGDDEIKELTIANALVETLVQFGRIPNDEFNGIIWGTEGGPFRTPKLVSRHKEVA